MLDPDGLYVPPSNSSGPNDEQRASSLDFIEPTTGISEDPVEAARQSIEGFEPGDIARARVDEGLHVDASKRRVDNPSLATMSAGDIRRCEPTPALRRRRAPSPSDCETRQERANTTEAAIQAT